MQKSMRKSMLVVVLLLVGQTAGAQNAQEGDRTKVMTFSRDDVLTGVTIIDGVTGAWAIYSLASGNTSGLADGITILATAPAIIFGAAVLGQDSSDGAMWVATLAAGAILSVATIDIIRKSTAPSGERVRTFSKNLILVPRVEPMPNERSARVSLALAGTF
jgi:hypothetical protein